MKKMWRKMLFMVLALVLVLPITAFAGFNLGGILGGLGGSKPSVPGKGGGSMDSGTFIVSGTVFADGAPLARATIYAGQGLNVVVANNTVTINGECNRETATDENGKFSCGLVTTGPQDIVIWKQGYAPIVKKGLVAATDLGRMNTSTEGGVNNIDFKK
jgi:hypothetical protein